MNIISFILLSVFIILAFNVSPKDYISEHVSKGKYTSLYSICGLKKNKFTTFEAFLYRNRYILHLYNKENVCVSFLLSSFFSFIFGVIVSLLLSNIFLIIPLAILFASIPLIIMDMYTQKLNGKIKEELVSSLYQITSEYIRTNDLLQSFLDNIEYIKNPVLKDAFFVFIFDLKNNPNGYKDCIYKLKNVFSYKFFSRYLDALCTCIDDSSNKHILYSYIYDEKSENRIKKKINGKIKGIKSEMYIMLSLVLLNYPLIYFLNPDWFNNLFTTLIGKIIISISVIFVLVSFIIMKIKTNKINEGEKTK